jgi:hypothetical protein
MSVNQTTETTLEYFIQRKDKGRAFNLRLIDTKGYGTNLDLNSWRKHI